MQLHRRSPRRVIHCFRYRYSYYPFSSINSLFGWLFQFSENGNLHFSIPLSLQNQNHLCTLRSRTFQFYQMLLPLFSRDTDFSFQFVGYWSYFVSISFLLHSDYFTLDSWTKYPSSRSLLPWKTRSNM